MEGLHRARLPCWLVAARLQEDRIIIGITCRASQEVQLPRTGGNDSVAFQLPVSGYGGRVERQRLVRCRSGGVLV